MAALARYIGEVFGGAWSLASGMALTLRYLFRPVTTVQYPRQRLAIPEAWRGHTELRLLPETQTHACVACGECARTCPSGVIKVQGEKLMAGEPNRGRFYYIDYSRCSFCGLCVEVCPRQALAFTREYDQLAAGRYGAVVDLMARLKEKTA